MVLLYHVDLHNIKILDHIFAICIKYQIILLASAHKTNIKILTSTMWKERLIKDMVTRLLKQISLIIKTKTNKLIHKLLITS